MSVVTVQLQCSTLTLMVKLDGSLVPFKINLFCNFCLLFTMFAGIEDVRLGDEFQ